MLRLAALLLTLLTLAGPALAQDEQPDLTITESYARGLQARIFAPQKPARRAPAILLFHGGGWVAGEAAWTDGMARQLAVKGVVGISIEYRLSDATVTPADAFADVCDAFAWARTNAARLGIDPRRIGGYGVSAGGQLTALAGTKGCPDGRRVWRPALMLLHSPPVDVAKDRWFGKLMRGAPALPQSPLQAAGRGTPPTFIIQGEKDVLAPARDSQAFCAAVRAARGVCEIDLYPALGHLLTRNLANQEDDFDPDPEAVRSSRARLFAFLRRFGWVR